MYSVLLASSLLILIKSAQCEDPVFLDFMTDIVPGGNFTYYSTTYTGTLILILISHMGDCDMYISQYIPKPTFENYAYCLQSTSCGVDIIVVPERFVRPLSIGVYGHPFHEYSDCTVSIYQTDSQPDELDLTTLAAKFGGDEESEKTAEGEYSDYESLPFLLIIIYYLYSLIQYFFNISSNVRLTPSDFMQILFEGLFF